MKIFNISIYKLKFKLNLRIIILVSLILFLVTSSILLEKYRSEQNNIPFEEIQEEISDKEIQEEYSKEIFESYKNNKLICLTFDDGPSEYTKLLIDGLKERNVKATFFVLGKNIAKYPEYIKESYQNGNEIGIHGYTHKLFTRLNNEKILNEIEMTNAELLKLIDKPPTLIRVPYGSLNNRVRDLLEESNLQSVLWTVDSKDWRFLNVDKDYNYVIKKVKGNEIVLMHDTYKPTVLAAFKIIDELKNQGYKFVTISEYINCIHDNNN